MKLIQLIDRAGQVRAWTDRGTGWISDLNGNAIALIYYGGVFKAQAHAQQIGWHECEGVIQNRRGQVVLVQPDAKVDGLVMPRSQRIPAAPKLRLPITRPVLNWGAPPPIKQRTWADFETLFDGLAQLRAFEQKIRTMMPNLHRTSRKGTAKYSA